MNFLDRMRIILVEVVHKLESEIEMYYNVNLLEQLSNLLNLLNNYYNNFLVDLSLVYYFHSSEHVNLVDNFDKNLLIIYFQFIIYIKILTAHNSYKF